MSLRASLEALVQAAPLDATVTVRWLGELLAAAEGEAVRPRTPASDAVVDLTVQQVATRFGRGVSTVRTWLERGDLPGSYKNHGREWRIPVSAVEAMQRAQATQHHASTPRPTTPRHRADIGEWRKHLPHQA